MSSVAIRVLLLAALAAPAAAQDRPSEEDLFGAPKEAPTPEPKRDEPARPDESEVFGTPPTAGSERATSEPAPEARTEARLGRRLAETEDPLRIGGQLYLRAIGSSRRHEPPSRWTLTAPSLVDLFVDVRPSDRVRAFALARTRYDPTIEERQGALPSTDSAASTETLSLIGATGKVTDVAIDQLWVRFDVGRRAFLTLGKQHVKWGVGRFWNPTDFLHATPRDPLATFDARTGTTMARVTIPWEARGASVQAAAILEPLLPAEDPGAPRSSELGGLGLAVRGELPVGAAELGAGAVVQKGRPSRLGLDVSAGIWELDVYGELALRSAPEVPLWREVDPALPPLQRFARFEPGGPNPSATLGASWSWKYSDEDALTVGAEYAYHRNGYGDAHVYPWLLLNDVLLQIPGATTFGDELRRDFVPFYLGRHYAGAYLFLPGPGSWNDASFTLSTLGNLSDGSFLTRLDGSYVFLTYLRFEAFTAVHYGTEGGEFRLGLDIPPQVVAGVQTPRIVVGAPLFDVGVALRIAL